MRCSHDGCTDQVQKGGVCWTHGANKDTAVLFRFVQID